MRRFAVVLVALMLAGCSREGGGAVEVTAGATPAGVPAVTTSAMPTAAAPPTNDTAPRNDTAPKDKNDSAPGSGSKAEPKADITVESRETFTMPRVTGMNLQVAQDALQKKGSYLMDQEDASGEHRIQLIDSHWKVCTQIPRAGREVPLSTVVRLAAVKLDERCP
jgi:hypothetical protein